MSQYSTLSRAQLSYDYLHTNSTTHEFLFGALAELIDNARDATATKINIYTVPNKDLRGGFMLAFLDDGRGMDAGEAADIVTFGKSRKKSMDSQYIGMYGNGLKSGSMRIANDLLMFTKCGQEMTCVFLSRTFHEVENIDEIIVPMPVFDTLTKKPAAKSPNDKKKHSLEMSIILKYSPFKTEAEFMKEFERIDGNSGTLVILYNMKLLDTGEPELDIKSCEHDILLSNPATDDFDPDEGLMPERRSFRAYTSILYVDPRMRIYIQDKKVQTKRLASCLYKPRMYRYSSNRFKARSEQESKNAYEQWKIADNRAKEAESKARNLETKLGEKASKEKRAELRKVQANALECRKEAQLKKQIADRKSKAMRGPKTISFTFGINLEHRAQDGMFVYNCSRLIKMYQKVGSQTVGGAFCAGVVGVVDVPYLVLEPTHNKQDFADAKEYRHLQKAMGEHMMQYWKDVGIAQQGVTKFWENYGYTSQDQEWMTPASKEPKYVKKRAMQIQTTIQCNLCLKWRMLPFSSATVGKEYPDDWTCSLNPDPTHNRCSSSEQKLNIPEGTLKKETKSQEQKEHELEQEIRKKQEALNKLQKFSASSSKSGKGGRRRDSSSSSSESSEESSEEDNKKYAKKSHGISRSSRTPINYNESNLSNSSSKKSFTKPKRTHTSTTSRPPNKQSSSTSLSTISSSASRRTSSGSKLTTSASRRTVTESSSSSSDEDDEPPAKKKPNANNAVKSQVNKSSDEGKDVERNHRGYANKPDSNDESIRKKPRVAVVKADIGRRAECKIGAKWFTGNVTDVDIKQNKWRVKFDKYPTDKHDRWYEINSTDIKYDKISDTAPTKNGSAVPLENASGANTNSNTPTTTASNDTSSTTATNSTASTTTAPATTTTAANAGSTDGAAASLPTATNNEQQSTKGDGSSSSSDGTAPGTSQALINQYSDEIANGYRTCLRYFLPPQWIMDKESVSTLSLQELVQFPLDDFFDHYEKGLRKLVGSFQYEAQVKQQECDQHKTKLSEVRKLIAKLLKSINEEFDIDPEADTDQVDELLEACVRQASATSDTPSTPSTSR